jgi:rhamnose utilization protein RhaD (predicted bifunctional aldolase and dehydrogenase)/NAD(P)-dependent dehydrogenase (short-subunit alcohol dehydrogenase family)
MAGALEPEARALLDELVEVSRSIGSNPRLVLHGGGNTSVKGGWRDVTGAVRQVLLVKGSGQDLAHVDATGFAPLCLERLRELLPPTVLDQADLAGELRCALVDDEAPDPSVEALVHAALPHTAVVHSHADAIVTLSNTPTGRELVAEVCGPEVLIVDYAMSGPTLAAACQAAWEAAGEAQARVTGLVVLNHGLFTVGDTPRQALERHAALVAAAEERLTTVLPASAGVLDEETPAEPFDAVALAALRKRICERAGTPLVVRRRMDAQVRAFLADPAALEAARRGPLTPDHVIWTRHAPMVGDDLEAFAADRAAYVAENAARTHGPVPVLDDAPRVVLHPELGLLSAGRTGAEAVAVERIYRHTMSAVVAAEALGGYRPADRQHIFDLEHWGAQREKVERTEVRSALVGKVAIVTGAASGIGRACAAELLASGASVVGWDVSADVAGAFDSPEWIGLQVDVTDPAAQRAALDATVAAFGGLDILVVSAGVFPTAAHLDVMDMAVWRRTMAINVDAVAELYGMAHPLLKEAVGGGRVVVVASKNVPAPGPGAAAYSSSKAALTQLSRVAALEWAPDGIRVNMVHPDAVFDTALWTPELLEKRAAHYGMSVDAYKRRNLLRTEVTSAAVGRLVRSMADDTFACTTGAQVPIDGGNERVI